jgi:leucyl-tRNA synthetase
MYIHKIDKAINHFQLNVAIAQFYELYKHFNDAIKIKINNDVLIKNLIKFMRLMIPFTPHLAFECLSNLNCDKSNVWPEVNEELFSNIKINMAVQVNGKTRDVININKDLEEKELNSFIIKSSKAKKYIVDKEIIKTIYIKNKIINYIVKE